MKADWNGLPRLQAQEKGTPKKFATQIEQKMPSRRSRLGIFSFSIYQKMREKGDIAGKARNIPTLLHFLIGF